MKKRIHCALALALTLAMLAGCGSGGSSGTSSPASDTPSASSTENVGSTSAPSGEKVKLTWLSEGPGSHPTSRETLTAPILQKYTEETGVEVVGEFYPFNDLFEVIEVKVASGSSDYDAIIVDVPMVAAYATRGYLLPADNYFSEDEKAGFIESARNAGSWQGTFYAPPMNTSSQLLFYNKELLDKAGVTVPESTVEKRLTWEQVVDMATQALDKLDPDRNQGMAGIMFQQVSRTYQMCAVPNSLGEPSIAADGITVDGVLNSDGWVKAMTWYQDLFNNKLSLRGITGDETKDYFTGGRILFMIGGTWTANDAETAGMNFGYAPCPAFAGYEDKVATPTGSWHLGINAASKHPDETADFIKWMTLGEGNAMWLKANNDVPSNLAAIEAIENDPNASDIMKIASYEAAHTAVPRALTPGYNEYSSVLDATLEDIRNGTDVKTALDNAVSQINTQFERYK